MERNRISYPQPVILPVPSAQPRKEPAAASATFNTAFQQALQKQTSDIKFSQHAQQRLQARNIELSQPDMEKLGNAVDKAAQKGAKESLILLNRELALVVSIKNRTVITAMDSASMKDNIVTNIDSAVIV